MIACPWRRSGALLLLPLLLLQSLGGCAPRRLERRFHSTENIASVPNDRGLLKAHMHDGTVYVFSRWNVVGRGDELAGDASHLDANRRLLGVGPVSVPVDSVALFESNELRQSAATGGLIALTMISGVVAALCLANPKSCFGSCPTFFVHDGEDWRLVAEGFSASVAPSLEATDVDALYRVRGHGRRLEMKLTNEALETHVIRRADLLAVPTPPGQRAAFSTREQFVMIDEPRPPVTARDEQGDCLPQLRAADGLERISLADSLDLARREFIELEFDLPEAGEWGLVLGMRQSLMSTYLFYQALAYLGKDAGHWLAELERRGEEVVENAQSVGRALGGVEVQIPDKAGGWISLDEIHETGPLASDFDLAALGVLDAGSLRLRLRLTAGLWRLDHVGVARMGGAVEPERLHPVQVLREGELDELALAALLDESQTMVTLPGDELMLIYERAAGFDDTELFVESRGYYLEWMREEWVVEENKWLAAQMLIQPDAALRRLAPAYKEVEGEMEQMFWGSRYARP